jgi:hypothetical protein
MKYRKRETRRQRRYKKEAEGEIETQTGRDLNERDTR